MLTQDPDTDTDTDDTNNINIRDGNNVVINKAVEEFAQKNAKTILSWMWRVDVCLTSSCKL